MLFKRERLFSSFVTPDFKKRQNRNETRSKAGTKFTEIFAFLAIKFQIPLILKVQTRTTLEQKIMAIKNEQFRTIKKKHDLKHCQTCWRSLDKLLVRIIEQFGNLKEFKETTNFSRIQGKKWNR